MGSFVPYEWRMVILTVKQEDVSYLERFVAQESGSKPDEFDSFGNRLLLVTNSIRTSGSCTSPYVLMDYVKPNKLL